MIKKSIILYDLKNKTSKEKTDITRKLFGFNDKSNNGNYIYKRKGFLKDTKHEKWNKSVILINSEDEAKVSNILRKFGLKVLIARLPD